MTTLAILSALLLAGFLLLRPRLGEIGRPTPPDTSGRARRHIPDGTATETSPEAAPPGTGASGAESEATARAGITHSDEIERAILELVNENRRQEGRGNLKNLDWDDLLTRTARNHSDDMLARRFFDHVNPDGLAPADRIALAHRQLVGLTGENIWMQSGYALSEARKTAELIVREWMESPGHRENILRPDYTHLGVGVSIKGDEVRATQNFALVRALIDQPMPLEVKSGEVLHLATTPGAEKYDFWLSSSGLKVGEGADIADGTVRVNPGVYKLRFYFPTPGGYTIFTGPQVEVK
ncbi:MAG: CAP domain-containing protein [Acidobacteria bacterium]|nr:CAP domain-containing protein [Acidobacteriota bacterium]